MAANWVQDLESALTGFRDRLLGSAEADAPGFLAKVENSLGTIRQALAGDIQAAENAAHDVLSHLFGGTTPAEGSNEVPPPTTPVADSPAVVDAPPATSTVGSTAPPVEPVSAETPVDPPASPEEPPATA
jgi:hypothetical protein